MNLNWIKNINTIHEMKNHCSCGIDPVYDVRYFWPAIWLMFQKIIIKPCASESIVKNRSPY